MGIAIYTGGSDVTIANVTIKNVINSGIYTTMLANSIISNCTVLNGGDNPITLNGNLDGGANGNWNTIIEYCTVIGGQDVGINTFHADNCTIRYNTVRDVLQYESASHWGIAAEASSNVAIIGNTVTGCDLNIASYSDDTLIADNIVIGAANTCVGIQVQGCSGDIVKNNTVIDCMNFQSIGTYSNKVTKNLQIIDNTIINSGKIGVAGTNVVVSGGTINAPKDADGGICLTSAVDVHISNVVFKNCAAGIID